MAGRAFRHPLFRADVYDQLGAASRTAAHARIAAVLEDATAEPAVLAQHLAQGAPLGNAEAAARYAMVAGWAGTKALDAATHADPGRRAAAAEELAWWVAQADAALSRNGAQAARHSS